MKRRLFGIMLIVSLMLIPSFASAATYPMDGTYIGAASIVAPPPPATPEFLMTFRDYTAVIGGGGTTFQATPTGAVLPSSSWFNFGPLTFSGVVLEKTSDSSISITGDTDDFRGTGVLNFMDLHPVFGFMTAFLNVSGTSSFILGGDENFLATAVFSKQAPTPIPGAIWLLGSGLVGLVGFRRKLKK